MPKQRPPRRNSQGLPLPPKLPEEPASQSVLDEYYRWQRRSNKRYSSWRLPHDDGEHHLCWPSRWYRERGGDIWRFRQHPLNILGLDRDEHRWAHILLNTQLEKRPGLIIAELDTDTMVDFVVEGQVIYDLRTAIGALATTEAKIQRTSRQHRPPLARLEEARQEQLEVVEGIVERTQAPEVVPPELMQLGVQRLLARITSWPAAA